MSRKATISITKTEGVKTYQAQKSEKWAIDYDTDFTQVYEDAFDLIKGMKRSSSYELLFWILKNMNKENIISLGIYNKNKFSSEIQCCISTVDKAIKELKRKNILESVGGGTYKINVFYFWRSNEEIRKQRIREVVKEVEQGERDPKTLGIEAYTKQDVRYD